MTEPAGAAKSLPEFHSDGTAANGLIAALEQVAADLGLELGTPAPVLDDYHADVRFPAPDPGHPDLTIKARRFGLFFLVDNNESDIAHARGYTSDLTEVAKAVAAWFAGADPRGMKAAASFIDLPLMAEARATGSVELVVEANWRQRQERWRRQRELKPDSRREAGALTAVEELLDAAYAEPRLRCLYAVTSHFNLWFSQCTDFPFARVGVVIEPQSGGRYRIWKGRSRDDESELVDSPQAAAARAAELLPSDCGAAILGTAADLPAWLSAHPDTPTARYIASKQAAADSDAGEGRRSL